jgi:type VI secretion system FHA domain protein
VTLTLEIITTATAMPSVRQRTFREDGGRIGRDKGNDWVLPHNKVSSRHAVVTYRNGVFYIEDRSRNGVFLNSTTNRLTPGRPQALQSGDCLFIEPYEIQVSVAEEADARALRFQTDNDPFAHGDILAPDRPGPLAASDPLSADDESPYEVDPLKLLGGRQRESEPRPPARDKILTVDELERHDPMAGHYQPPRAAFEPPPATPSAEPVSIPPDYDPMAPDVASTPPRFLPLSRSEAPAPVAEPASAHSDSAPTPAPVPRPAARESGARPRPPQPKPPPATPPAESKEDAKVAPAVRGSDGDLAAVLAGVGLGHVQVTPELAENFGRILKVVVAGVMDLLRARQQVKDELRMRQTQFKPSDNNPLKFSANVDDALHNLLVKRNPAYLQPVEAFADAFDDLRDHQLAMLAGLRVAFEAMLADFDPDRLEEQFDRRFKKGALLSVPAKLRYWDSYREKTRQLLLDVDGAFRKWFGEEFVKAYEEQLERLETERQQRNS